MPFRFRDPLTLGSRNLDRFLLTLNRYRARINQPEPAGRCKEMEMYTPVFVIFRHADIFQTAPLNPISQEITQLFDNRRIIPSVDQTAVKRESDKQIEIITNTVVKNFTPSTPPGRVKKLLLCCLARFIAAPRYRLIAKNFLSRRDIIKPFLNRQRKIG